MTQFVLTPVAQQVILGLAPAARQIMAECFVSELDPVDEARNVTRAFPLQGRSYTAVLMSNGWTAVIRDITERTLGFAHETKIAIFDLLSPESGIDSGIGIM
jgi:hypothetical protein